MSRDTSVLEALISDIRCRFIAPANQLPDMGHGDEYDLYFRILTPDNSLVPKDGLE